MAEEDDVAILAMGGTEMGAGSRPFLSIQVMLPTSSLRSAFFEQALF